MIHDIAMAKASIAQMTGYWFSKEARWLSQYGDKEQAIRYQETSARKYKNARQSMGID